MKETIMHAEQTNETKTMPQSEHWEAFLEVYLEAIKVKERIATIQRWVDQDCYLSVEAILIILDIKKPYKGGEVANAV